ncbi:cilia- and flagella-associated protein 53-like [Anneissia japonica]|uniref:cilia- and flagella-associated protein 53-like n=1 Tax=Anneissia japonica TaxID=1529436 RepID=UPI0014257EEA|nr:cilia- and flagella-associated protein 53-like [Anneissia japonica]
MLATQKPRKTREFTGPTPHSVAIRAKFPSKRPPDHLILERRRKDDLREEAESITRYNKLCDMKNDWEKITDVRIQKNTVKGRVNNLLQQQEFKLEDRRERLRELLATEERQYIAEMEASQETILERQAKMRTRAKFLKEKRETERLQVVAEKLDQRWREECEELRATLSRRHMDEVCTERFAQLRMKDEMHMQKLEEDKMYADLWEQDRLSKAAREEKESQEQHERNRDMVETLQKQKAALEAQKEEEKRLKEEEGRLLTEERELRRLEEEEALREKRRRQAETRQVLSTSIKLKMKKKARELQEELALDMKILEKLLEDTRNEALEVAQRKRELREEDRVYRDYLQQQMAEEARREKEIDQMIDEEVRKQWQKRLDQWAKERVARKQLMENVLKVRHQQVQERLAANSEAQKAAQAERESMQAAMAEHKRLEKEHIANIRHQNLKYQQDLLDQAEYINCQREIEKDEDYRHYLKGIEAEANYQAKLKEALARPVVDKAHPMRRAYMERMSAKVREDRL